VGLILIYHQSDLSKIQIPPTNLQRGLIKDTAVYLHAIGILEGAEKRVINIVNRY